MKHAKRRLVALAVSILLLGIVAQAAGYQYFPDVPDDASYAYEINALKEAGIFTGDSSGNFLPNNTMTRAEAAALLVRLFVDEGEAKPATGTFSDVPSSHWAYGYIETAVQQGMISGYGGGKFGPGDELTYAQAVTLLVKAMGYEEMAQELGGWPDGYINMGGGLGITDDTVNLAENPVPRNVVAKLIYNAWYEDKVTSYDDNEAYNDDNEVYDDDWTYEEYDG